MKESRTLSCKLPGSQSSWRDYRWLCCSVCTICLWTWWERHNTVSCSSSPWLINNWLVIFTAFGDVYTLLPVVPLLLGIMGSELLEAKCKWRKTAQVANHQTYHTPSDLSRSQESYVTAIACSSCLHSILNKILVLACTTEQLFMNASSSLLGNCSVSCTRTSLLISSQTWLCFCFTFICVRFSGFKLYGFESIMKQFIKDLCQICSLLHVSLILVPSFCLLGALTSFCCL